MSGETNLDTLLGSMQPSMDSESYVFVTGVRNSLGSISANPVMTFREDEGTTWIVTELEAAKLDCTSAYVSRKITLNVHSSLEAVGFLAVIATELARGGISVNPVSAYFHDHLFVPAQKAELALKILNEISQSANHRAAAKRSSDGGHSK